ncbi:sel1 repeat family protein [Luminiphilus sp.]|nr:sel1 repeat family protein [Luminiphilus sp.]
MSVIRRAILLCAAFWLPLLGVADNREDQLRAGLAAMDRQHYATAMRAWYDLASAGDPQAQHNIGYLYEEGLGVTQQYDVAMDWYRRAADGGLSEANHNLGMMYVEGRGAAKSWAQGLIHFRKAAAEGLIESRYMIALSYFEGEGQIRNRRLAFEGFRETAIEGYADSQYMLSFMLLDGTDVKRRSGQAYVWASLGLMQGQQQAQEIRDAASMRIGELETSDALFVLSQCEAAGVKGCLPALDSLR